MLHQECFHVHNDSCKVSFELVDVNLDFWHLSPFPALQTTEMAGFEKPHPILSRGHLAHPQRNILITIEPVQVSRSYFVTFPKI